MTERRCGVDVLTYIGDKNRSDVVVARSGEDKLQVYSNNVMIVATPREIFDALKNQGFTPTEPEEEG